MEQLIHHKVCSCLISRGVLSPNSRVSASSHADVRGLGRRWPRLIPLSAAFVLFAVRAPEAAAEPQVMTIEGDVACSSRPASWPIVGASRPAAFRIDLHGVNFRVKTGDLPAGSYSVEIDAAETYFTNRGSRVMSVFCGEQTLIRDLDLVAAVSTNRAYTISGEVQHAGGPLTLRFEATVNRAKFSEIRVYDAKGGLVAQLKASPELATEKKDPKKK